MADFSKILLLADFDRTLTDSRSRIPARNLEAIRSFTARGGAFTVASGRSIPMFRSRQGEIPYNVPLILYNGAAAYDYRTEALEDPMPVPGGKALIRWLAKEYPDLNLEFQNARYHCLVGPEPRRDAFYRANSTAHIHVTPENLPDEILKVSLLGTFRNETVRQFFTDDDPQEIARFDEAAARIAALWPSLTVDRAANRILDIQAKSVNKGTAGRRLAQRLGRELLVCVGDARNDLSMLLEADLAFAPGDCEPAVREAGIPTVCACDGGSVAEVIALLEAQG